MRTLRFDQLKVHVLDHSDAVAVAAADRILEVISDAVAARNRVVLGLATGASPLGLYRELVSRGKKGDFDPSKWITFNLDERRPMRSNDLHSYHAYMRRVLFEPLNFSQAQTHVPDGALEDAETEAHCRDYRAAIVAAGGIDAQIVGLGRTGHLGFNEPGSTFDSRMRRVKLEALTLRDAAEEFGTVAWVPKEAITLGLADIFEARRIIGLAMGEAKTEILSRMCHGKVSPELPASMLRNHSCAEFFVDVAAAAQL